MEDLKHSIHKALNDSGTKFKEINQKSGGYVDYMVEVNAMYKMLLASISRQSGIAYTSLNSIVDAFFDIARTGLSICPSRQLACMRVVFDESIGSHVCRFDIGYRGFLELASRSSGIKVITADVIYCNDKFRFNGSRSKVDHLTTTLSTSLRGDFAGGYCTSELADGSIVTTVMSPEEIQAIEDVCRINEDSAWNSPFIDEMRRKTLIKRHWKTLSTVAKSSFSSDLLHHVSRISATENSVINQQQEAV